MTIIVNEQEFVADHRNLLDICDKSRVVIQRKDGLFFSLEAIVGLPEEDSDEQSERQS